MTAVFLASTAAGLSGVALGFVAAALVARRQPRYPRERSGRGELLLWVRLRRPEGGE